jgi:hypothetical protein
VQVRRRAVNREWRNLGNLQEKRFTVYGNIYEVQNGPHFFSDNDTATGNSRGRTKLREWAILVGLWRIFLDILVPLV